jgi:hypothetical protein
LTGRRTQTSSPPHDSRTSFAQPPVENTLLIMCQEAQHGWAKEVVFCGGDSDWAMERSCAAAAAVLLNLKAGLTISGGMGREEEWSMWSGQ